MIAAALIELLRCPETKQHVAPATADVVAKLDAARAEGQLRSRSGNIVEAPIEEGLIRADGAVFFPMRDGIPIMLIEDSITLS